MKNKTILELHEMLLNKSLSCSQLLNYYNNNLKKIIQDKTNAVLLDLSEYANKSANELDKMDVPKDNLLFGIVATLKDNINFKGYQTTGGSKYFKDYISVYSATVAQSLLNNNVIINSKTNMDELGLGGTGLYSGFGEVVNNIYSNYITGGSSSGSVLAVANHACQFAIATDTGDSIRRPCSLMGLVGFKPTYGAISRYGVFPYSPSFDHVGIITNSVTDTAIVSSYVFNGDKKDSTSISLNLDYKKCLSKLNSKIKLAYISNLKNIWNDSLEKEVYFNLLEKLSTNENIELIEINLDNEIINILAPLYQVISYSEACSCWNNLSGVIFGPKSENFKNYNELIYDLRTKYLSQELKKRFVFGTIATSSYNFNVIYLKSRKILNVIKNLFNEYFNSVDCFILPGASSVAYKVMDVKENKVNTNNVDDLLQIANFAQLPSITLPYTKINNLPFGINLFSKKKNDEKLLQIAYYFEQHILKD